MNTLAEKNSKLNVILSCVPSLTPHAHPAVPLKTCTPLAKHSADNSHSGSGSMMRRWDFRGITGNYTLIQTLNRIVGRIIGITWIEHRHDCKE